MIDPFRDALLWASTNRTLGERLPRLPFVRATVARFMPGETAIDALDAAAALSDRGIACAFTHLGENVHDEAQAVAVVEHYLGMIDRIADRGLDGELSVKLTHLGLDLGTEVAATNVLRLAERAEERGTRVWLDMEVSPYVDRTIAIYRRMLDAHPTSGICLQVYLHRTPQDVADLLPLDPSIRFVKGAYREADDVAIQRRPAVGAAFRKLALETLRRRPAGGRGRLVIGTHDVDLVRRIDADARALGFERSDLEVEMLFGIRSADQAALVFEGFRVRTLIAYGPHWYPWFMRRLAERPANVLIALRNLVARPSP